MRLLLILLLLPILGIAQPSYNSYERAFYKTNNPDTIKFVSRANDTSFINFGNQEIIITSRDTIIRLSFIGNMETLDYVDGSTYVSVDMMGEDGIKGIFGMTFLKDGSPSHCYFSNKNGMTRWEKMTKN